MVVTLGTLICACKSDNTRSVRVAANHFFAELGFLFHVLPSLTWCPIQSRCFSFHITVLDPGLLSVLHTKLCENKGLSLV